jgi:hypothetical protein
VPERYTSEVKKGNIVAFTCVRPMWTFTSDIPCEPIKAFELRYLLVYPDNVDDMMRRYPSVFRK